MSTNTFRELDAVALRRRHGTWAPGTTGAVVQMFDKRAALVELAGPDGHTLDMLTVPLDDLVLVHRPGSTRRNGPGRLAS